MTRLFLCTGLLLATLGACTGPADQVATPPATLPATKAAARPSTGLLTYSYAGEYQWGDPKRKEAGGTLTIYPESDSTVLLALDICNGPPAFHLGNMYRRAVVRRGVGRCTIEIKEDMLHCQFRLVFAPQSVVITTEPGHGECGFGQGISADGTYSRTSASVPQYFTDSSGDKTFFSKTTPEKYNAVGD